MSENVREYLTTHPHLTFNLDLRPASPRLWMLIGEANSKCEQLTGVPLAPEAAEKLNFIYLAKGAWASASIEGNTLTEEQGLHQLKGDLKLPADQEYLGQEVQNIIDACNQLSDELGETEPLELSAALVRRLNKMVLEGLKLPDHVVPGRIRNYPVGVGNYRGAPFQDCNYLLDRLWGWDVNLPGFPPLAASLLKAILANVYINCIHPFGEGNGRTARLIEFYILITAGVPKPAAQLLSYHYNQTRAEYYRQLVQSFRPGGSLLPFIEYTLQGFVDGLKRQLQSIRAYQWKVAWRDYLNKQFEGKTGKSDIRKHLLMIDLSEREYIDISEVRHVSPRVAELYAERTAKTIARDLLDLNIELDLINVEEHKLRANREKLLAFMPAKRPAAEELPTKQGRGKRPTTKS